VHSRRNGTVGAEGLVVVPPCVNVLFSSPQFSALKVSNSRNPYNIGHAMGNQAIAVNVTLSGLYIHLNFLTKDMIVNNCHDGCCQKNSLNM